LAKRSKLKYILKLKEFDIKESLKFTCFTETTKGPKIGETPEDPKRTKQNSGIKN